MQTTSFRMTISEAAKALSCCSRTLIRRVDEGVFTAIRPLGRGPGKPIFLDPKEVELYGRGEMESLREYQARKRPRKSKASK